MKISINNILKNMPNNLSDLEKVRYIYIEIGKIFSYNRDFLYVSNYRILDDIYSDTITINMIENGNYQNKINSICKQTAEIEANTINLLNGNITARIVGYNKEEQDHVAVVATIDGKDYFLDISPDLYKIQKGMKPKGFAKSSQALDGTTCEIISDEELTRIDEKIGYCKNGMYLDEVLEMLKTEMMDENNLREYMQEYTRGKDESKEEFLYRFKIDFIFKYLKNNILEENKMGIFEIIKYYETIFKRILTEQEKKYKRKRFDIYLKDDNQIRKESILYKIIIGDREIYYIYDDDKRSFVPIDREELKRLGENGNIEYLDLYNKPTFDER